MAVNVRGEVIGSVSGGCVEGAVVDEALGMFTEPTGAGPSQMSSFAYSDDEAFAVGLTCGGTIRLFLQRLDFGPAYEALLAATTDHTPVALLTVVAGPTRGAMLTAPSSGGEPVGTLGGGELDAAAVRDALGDLASGRNAIRHYGTCDEAGEQTVTVFVESFPAPPRLVIFGAVDLTAALARAGKLLGFHVIICDAREVFATVTRFPMADEVVVDWPHRYIAGLDDGAQLGPRDAVCVLTHDHKFDVPAIAALVQTDVGYIGALGSRRTHSQRMALLSEAGVTDAALSRVMAPIGLDLGATTPEETAVSICAEIIASRTGRVVPSLRDRVGPIH